MSIDTTALIKQVDLLKNKQLTRYSDMVGYIDSIPTSGDQLRTKIKDGLFADSEAELGAVTDSPEDQGTYKNLFCLSGVEKSMDPVLQTGIADSNSLEPGSAIAQATGTTSSSDTANRITNTIWDPSKSPMTAIPGGTLAQGIEDSTGLIQTATQMQQKAFNTVSAIISKDPTSAVADALLGKIDSFGGGANDLVVKFLDFNAKVGQISSLTASLDSSYYNYIRSYRIMNARSYLVSADGYLTHTREGILGNDRFDEESYASARFDVGAASRALVDYGNPSNKVVQINGLMDILDMLMGKIYDLYGEFMNQLYALRNYFNDFLSHAIFNGPMLAMVNHCQAEIRSMIRAMTAVLTKNQPLLYLAKERVWWLECLALYKKMWMTPQNIVNYFSDPTKGGRYINAYDPFASQLSAIPFESALDLLQSQMSQLKYLVSKRLEADQYGGAILNLNLQIQSDNNQRVEKIEESVAVCEDYKLVHPVPGPEVDRTIPGLMVQSLRDSSMDRAADLYSIGAWKEIGTLTPQTGSYVGKTLFDINNTISAAEADPSIDYKSINSLWEAQRYVYNEQRSDDALAETFGRFKDYAKREINMFDIPQTRQMRVNVEQFSREASGV